MRCTFRLWLALLLLTLPQGLSAGAWPRDPGSWFLASGVELSFARTPERPGPVPAWSTLYVEYGLTGRLTLGLDLGLDPQKPDRLSAIVFLRHDLAPDARIRLAASAGIGTAGIAGDGIAGGRRILQAGLHAGRGFDSRFGGGWVNLDLLLRHEEGAPLRVKADLTTGISLSERTRVMLSLFADHARDDQTQLKLAPGITRRFGPLDLEFGVIVPAHSPGEIRLKLGLWQSF